MAGQTGTNEEASSGFGKLVVGRGGDEERKRRAFAGDDDDVLIAQRMAAAEMRTGRH